MATIAESIQQAKDEYDRAIARSKEAQLQRAPDADTLDREAVRLLDRYLSLLVLGRDDTPPVVPVRVPAVDGEANAQEIAELKRRLTDLARQKGIGELEIVALTRQYNETKNLLDASKQEVRRLKDSVSQIGASNDAFAERVRNLEAELAEAERQNSLGDDAQAAALREQLAAERQKAADLVAEREREQQELDNQRTTVANLQRQLQDLRRQVGVLEANEREQQRIIRQLQALETNRTQEQEAEINRLVARNRDLLRQLNECREKDSNADEFFDANAPESPRADTPEGPSVVTPELVPLSAELTLTRNGVGAFVYAQSAIASILDKFNRAEAAGDSIRQINARADAAIADLQTFSSAIEAQRTAISENNASREALFRSLNFLVIKLMTGKEFFPVGRPATEDKARESARLQIGNRDFNNAAFSQVPGQQIFGDVGNQLLLDGEVPIVKLAALGKARTVTTLLEQLYENLLSSAEKQAVTQLVRVVDNKISGERFTLAQAIAPTVFTNDYDLQPELKGTVDQVANSLRENAYFLATDQTLPRDGIISAAKGYTTGNAFRPLVGPIALAEWKQIVAKNDEFVDATPGRLLVELLFMREFFVGKATIRRSVFELVGERPRINLDAQGARLGRGEYNFLESASQAATSEASIFGGIGQYERELIKRSTNAEETARTLLTEMNSLKWSERRRRRYALTLYDYLMSKEDKQLIDILLRDEKFRGYIEQREETRKKNDELRGKVEDAANFNFRMQPLHQLMGSVTGEQPTEKEEAVAETVTSEASFSGAIGKAEKLIVDDPETTNRGKSIRLLNKFRTVRTKRRRAKFATTLHQYIRLRGNTELNDLLAELDSDFAAFTSGSAASLAQTNEKSADLDAYSISIVDGTTDADASSVQEAAAVILGDYREQSAEQAAKFARRVSRHAKFRRPALHAALHADESFRSDASALFAEQQPVADTLNQEARDEPFETADAEKGLPPGEALVDAAARNDAWLVRLYTQNTGVTSQISDEHRSQALKAAREAGHVDVVALLEPSSSHAEETNEEQSEDRTNEQSDDDLFDQLGFAEMVTTTRDALHAASTFDAAHAALKSAHAWLDAVSKQPASWTAAQWTQTTSDFYEQLDQNGFAEPDSETVFELDYLQSRGCAMCEKDM